MTGHTIGYGAGHYCPPPFDLIFCFKKQMVAHLLNSRPHSLHDVMVLGSGVEGGKRRVRYKRIERVEGVEIERVIKVVVEEEGKLLNIMHYVIISGRYLKKLHYLVLNFIYSCIKSLNDNSIWVR